MAEALNLFRDYQALTAKSGDVVAGKIIENYRNDAQKFVLPINGLVMDNNGKLLSGELRLPFPKIMLEFESELDPNVSDDTLADVCDKSSFVTNVYDRHIVFAEETKDGKLKVQLASKFKRGGEYSNVWNTVPMALMMERSIGEGGLLTTNVIPTHTKALEMQGKDFTWADFGLTLLRPAFKAIAELLEALTCSNVKAEKKPNKKRLAGRRPGQLPYDDYHELVVYANKSHSSSSEALEPTGVKRREHLRRGHIRTYQSGLRIWVQAHVVNAGSQGKIEKHYKVKK